MDNNFVIRDGLRIDNMLLGDITQDLVFIDSDGVVKSIPTTNVFSSTTITGYNKEQWDIAFDWGNHAATDGNGDPTYASYNHTHEYLSNAGGTLTGEVYFQDDGEGVTFNGGARIYKKVGGLILRRHSDLTEVKIENAAGTTSWDIWHKGNLTNLNQLTNGPGYLSSVPIFDRTTNGLVPMPGGSTTTRYLREDGTWVIPTTSMTLTELNTGTATTDRLIAAKTLNDWLNDKNYITGYTEVDNLDSVTLRGGITTNAITVGGATVNGDLSVTGLSNQAGIYSIDTTGRDTIVVTHPKGGVYNATTSAQIGAIKIKLPNYKSDTMLRFAVDIYDYTTDESFTVFLGGYDYANGWINVFVQIIGSNVNRDFNIRFGNDGVNSCVWIGELDSTWSWPQVKIKDFFAGFGGINSSWAENWNISIVTVFDTIDTIKSNNFPYADWNKLKGKPTDLATTGDLPTDYVDLTSNQDIGGVKNFTGITKFTYDSDNSHINLSGYGITFNRSTNYLRADTNGTKNLYIGDSTKGVKDWNQIYFYGTGYFRYNDNDIFHSGNLTPDDYLKRDGSLNMTGNLQVGDGIVYTEVAPNDINFYRAGPSYINQRGGGTLNFRTSTDITALAIDVNQNSTFYGNIINSNSSDLEMLLGGGGTKLLSDFSLSAHTHNSNDIDFLGNVDATDDVHTKYSVNDWKEGTIFNGALNAPSSGNYKLVKAGDFMLSTFDSQTGNSYIKTRVWDGFTPWRKIWTDGNFNPLTKADKTTTISPGTGLSGGGDLSTNRTLSFDTTWGDIRYALNSRLISPGTGLTGGGDLSANRTLTFDTIWGDARYLTSLPTHDHDERYLKLTGGTLTGSLSFTPGGAGAALGSIFGANTTNKSYINFNAVSGSSDPGFIAHETSAAAGMVNYGVIHLSPSDDNGRNDYVSIHGTNDPETVKIHTDGYIETPSDVYANSFQKINGAPTQFLKADGSVTEQTALSITESQISNLGDYLLRDGSLPMTGVLTTPKVLVKHPSDQAVPGEIELSDGGGVRKMILKSSNSGIGWSTIDTVTGDLKLMTHGATALNIESSTNFIGIGSDTTPSEQLEIFGNLKVSGDSTLGGVQFRASGATRSISTHSTAGRLELNGGTWAGDGSTIYLSGDTYNADGRYITIGSDNTTNTGNFTVGGLSNQAGIYSIENNVRDAIRVVNPKGGIYSGESSVTGAIKISLPVLNAGTMMRFTINTYEYSFNEGVTIKIGGYTTNNLWYNTFVQTQGSLEDRDFNVRFGNDGVTDCVWIGEITDSWTWLQVAITEVYAGHSGFADERWAENWNISLVTTFDTVDDTQINNFIWGDWNKLKGKPTDLATTGDIPTDYVKLDGSSTMSGALNVGNSGVRTRVSTDSIIFDRNSGYIKGQTDNITKFQLGASSFRFTDIDIWNTGYFRINNNTIYHSGNLTPDDYLKRDGSLPMTGDLTINTALKVDRPTDYWNGETYIGVDGGGSFSTQGSYSMDITSNGYRNSSSLWTSLNRNSETGASQIRVMPDGVITFNTEAVKNTGDSVLITERMRVSSNGNVGIGTNAPTEKLEVVGNILANSFINSTSDNNSMLLGGGGTKPLSDFALSSEYVKKAGDTMTGPLTVGGNIEMTSGWMITSAGTRTGIGGLPTLSANVLQVHGGFDLNNGNMTFMTNGVTNNAFYSSGSEIMAMRNFGSQPSTIFDIRSKVGDPTSDLREATLSLSRTDDNGNAEFLYLYNNGYHTGTPASVQHGIRIQKSGTGQLRPFVFDWYDGTTYTDGFTANVETGFNYSQPLTITKTDTPGETLFDIQGSAGQLFSITDSLEGDLFSVNDISGLPIFTVNSDDLVTINGSTISDSFVKSGGLSTEFLKADGTVDGTSYYHSGNLTPNDYLKRDGSLPMTGALDVNSAAGINSTGWIHLHRHSTDLNVSVGNDGTNINLLVLNGTISSTKFINSTSDDNSMLLGGGGTKPLSDFQSAGNFVTTDTTQSITGTKIFSGYIKGEGVSDLNIINQPDGAIKFIYSGLNGINKPPGNYFTGLHFSPLDSSDSYQGQIGMGTINTENSFALRVKLATTGWTPWRHIWHSGNFNPSDYQVTGDYIPRVYGGAWETAITNNIVGFNSSATEAPVSGTHFGILATLEGNDGYSGAFVMRNDRAWFQTREASALQGWREFYHSGNFTPSNYATTTSLTNYLPLVGGSLTGTLKVKTIQPNSSDGLGLYGDFNDGTGRGANIQIGGNGSAYVDLTIGDTNTNLAGQFNVTNRSSTTLGSATFNNIGTFTINPDTDLTTKHVFDGTQYLFTNGAASLPRRTQIIPGQVGLYGGAGGNNHLVIQQTSSMTSLIYTNTALEIKTNGITTTIGTDGSVLAPGGFKIPAGTADDVLLGNGTTTSLAALGGGGPESDTLQTVTDRGAVTTTAITTPSVKSGTPSEGCEMKYNPTSKTMDFIFS